MCLASTRVFKKFIFSLALVCFVLAASISFAWTGKVIGISDGDTIKVLTPDKRMVKIRLYGIDCPEKKQAFGKRAKWFCSDLVFGRNVEIEPVTKDRYGRVVALVYRDNLCLNRELVASGYAWVFPKYCKKLVCAEWYSLQREARKARIGLWKDPRPVSPWVWRKKRRAN